MTPAEIAALIPLIEQLEPEVQKGIAFLIGKLHKKQLTAQDYLTMAQTLISKEQPPAQ